MLYITVQYTYTHTAYTSAGKNMMLSNNKVYHIPISGPWVSPCAFVSKLVAEAGAANYQIAICAQLEKHQTITVHFADTIWTFYVRFSPRPRTLNSRNTNNLFSTETNKIVGGKAM